MKSIPMLQFKIATEEREFELIHELNYRTFVEEIPQHQPQVAGRLVDKFHAENTYLICLAGERLVGMLAMRGARPFSLDQKLSNLDSYLPSGRTLCEIRLLAIEKEFRNGQVLQGLLALVWQHGIEKGYDFALISGTIRQLKLYRHLGFIPFGPMVGSGEAMFQPMYLTLETFETHAVEFLRPNRGPAVPPASFLPGPVSIHRQVKEAFEEFPESHRSEGFVATLQSTQRVLCELTGAKSVEILLGTGTLANDVIAGQLSLREKRGLILSNGEFGERLIDHARRARLNFDTLKSPWGAPFDAEAVRRAVAEIEGLDWVWCVHCETSTGIRNDLGTLKGICGCRGIKLCLDGISSIGLVPVDLGGVYLASCVSGKALASFPGLSMVFYHHDVEMAPLHLPRYLDLGYCARHAGIPFTHSSNLVRALNTALKRVNWEKRFENLVQTSIWLRNRLRSDGFEILASDEHAAPGVVTIVLPRELSSVTVALQLQSEGYLLSFNSEYLRERNWIQICLMGEYSREKIVRMLRSFRSMLRNEPKPHRVEEESLVVAGSLPAAPI